MKKIRFKVQLVVFSDEEGDSGSHEAPREEIIELAVLDKNYHKIEQLGLNISESKEILKSLQKHILQRQVATFVEQRRVCSECGRRLGLKGRHTITFRTLFGDVQLESPRLRRCRKSRCTHLLLQNRTKTLNRELAATFRRWYPEFTSADDEEEEEPILAVA